MGDFFHGWRRKLGVVTLVIACVFVAGWVKSMFRHELIAWNSHPHRYFIESSFGRLHFVRTPHIVGSSAFQLSSNDPKHIWGYGQDENGKEFYDPMRHSKFHSRVDYGGFHFSESTSENVLVIRSIIPYWSVVIPLTLLSAWLLLSKPRRPNSKQTAESIPESVA